MTYKEALEYIHSVSWQGSRPGLERITELCSLLGNPQNRLRFIHVAGTNGKGSFCSMISQILLSAGYSVGLFTSPFIEEFNERIILNGKNISDEDLAAETSYVKQFADKMECPPTEFELITAIALSYYARCGCDFVVFECGLGGRLDSTNVISTPVLSVITGIDLDHTALLGRTTAEIAAEKAGIIKTGVPVLYGECDGDASRVIEEKTQEMKSYCRRVDYSRIHDIKSDLCGTEFYFGNDRVKINLLGLYQTRNAANVLTAIEMLREEGIKVPCKAVADGLFAARWKARFEILSRSPLVIYDGAHNPQGIRSAEENIRHYLSPLTDDGKVVLLMGVMADKDHRKMIGNLAPLCECAFTVTPQNARSLVSTVVEREFESFGVVSHAFSAIDDGVCAAVEFAQANGRPLVCLGSLYMYADVKNAVKKSLNI